MTNYFCKKNFSTKS